MSLLQQEAVTLLESRDVNGDIPEEDDTAAEAEGSEGEAEDAARALLGLPGIARGTGMAYLCIALLCHIHANGHLGQCMGVARKRLMACPLYTVHVYCSCGAIGSSVTQAAYAEAVRCYLHMHVMCTSSCHWCCCLSADGSAYNSWLLSVLTDCVNAPAQHGSSANKHNHHLPTTTTQT